MSTGLADDTVALARRLGADDNMIAIETARDAELAGINARFTRQAQAEDAAAINAKFDDQLRALEARRLADVDRRAAAVVSEIAADEQKAATDPAQTMRALQGDVQASGMMTLVGAIGASDPLQLDGLGGGSSLNSKVAIVSRSTEPGCDLDYLFAQVGVGIRSVDLRPNCGNMLSGVVPFAIERGLIEPQGDRTTVRVFNVNTRARIDVTVCTPGRRLTYEGNARIDGVEANLGAGVGKGSREVRHPVIHARRLGVIAEFE